MAERVDDELGEHLAWDAVDEELLRIERLRARETVAPCRGVHLLRRVYLERRDELGELGGRYCLLRLFRAAFTLPRPHDDHATGAEAARSHELRWYLRDAAVDLDPLDRLRREEIEIELCRRKRSAVEPHERPTRTAIAAETNGVTDEPRRLDLHTGQSAE